jgi:hypothetical protein
MKVRMVHFLPSSFVCPMPKRTGGGVGRHPRRNWGQHRMALP